MSNMIFILLPIIACTRTFNCVRTTREFLRLWVKNKNKYIIYGTVYSLFPFRRITKNNMYFGAAKNL